MPNVEGVDLALAEEELSLVGLQASIEFVPDDSPENTVLEQDPQAFTDVVLGSTVTLLVSSGPAECDPVAQTGCSSDEKCTAVIQQATDSDLSSTTECFPDGTVPLGGECTRDATIADGGSGGDDCVKGSFCSGGACVEICDPVENTCNLGPNPGDEACQPISGIFNTGGLCNETCNPVHFDTDGNGGSFEQLGCAAGEPLCFVNIFLVNGKATGRVLEPQGPPHPG